MGHISLQKISKNLKLELESGWKPGEKKLYLEKDVWKNYIWKKISQAGSRVRRRQTDNWLQSFLSLLAILLSLLQPFIIFACNCFYYPCLQFLSLLQPFLSLLAIAFNILACNFIIIAILLSLLQPFIIRACNCLQTNLKTPYVSKYLSLTG